MMGASKPRGSPSVTLAMATAHCSQEQKDVQMQQLAVAVVAGNVDTELAVA